MPRDTIRREWAKVWVGDYLVAYLGTAPPAHAACIRSVIKTLQDDGKRIDIHETGLGFLPAYSVWACDVLITAEIHNDDLGLIDVIVPDESV